MLGKSWHKTANDRQDEALWRMTTGQVIKRSSRAWPSLHPATKYLCRLVFLCYSILRSFIKQRHDDTSEAHSSGCCRKTLVIIRAHYGHVITTKKRCSVVCWTSIKLTSCACSSHSNMQQYNYSTVLVINIVASVVQRQLRGF